MKKKIVWKRKVNFDINASCGFSHDKLSRLAMFCVLLKTHSAIQDISNLG
jgi:hypothetical protein